MASSLDPQWGAIAVNLVITVAGIGAMFRHFGAREAVYNQYHRQRREARDAIVASKIVPALAALLHDAAEPVFRDGITFEEALQQVQYEERVGALAGYSADSGALQTLPSDIRTWMKREGWALIAVIVSLNVFMLSFEIKGWDIPQFITYVAGIILIVSLTLAGVCKTFEVTARNRLSAVLERYE